MGNGGHSIISCWAAALFGTGQRLGPAHVVLGAEVRGKGTMSGTGKARVWLAEGWAAGQKGHTEALLKAFPTDHKRDAAPSWR